MMGGNCRRVSKDDVCYWDHRIRHSPWIYINAFGAYNFLQLSYLHGHQDSQCFCTLSALIELNLKLNRSSNHDGLLRFSNIPISTIERYFNKTAYTSNMHGTITLINEYMLLKIHNAFARTQLEPVLVLFWFGAPSVTSCVRLSVTCNGVMCVWA